MEAKEHVVNRFLNFVCQFVELPQVRMATLGGMGVEAKEWVKAGIPPHHGSLIEIESDLARSLRQYKYRTHDRLGAFHTVLANYGETVDGFHLDLCGTMNVAVTGDFAPTIPFILRSQGRCLAVTMADARQNSVLSRWNEYRRRGIKFFGRKMRTIFAEFDAQQRKIPVKTNPVLPKFFKVGFNPHKAAKREFGFMVDMVELIQSYKCSIHRMERLVYVSRYNDRPFRMRTYFFHLGLGLTANPPKDLTRVWIESPLVFIDRDVVQVTATASAVAQQRETTKVKSQLALLVAASGNEELQREFNELLENSKLGAAMKLALNGYTDKISNGGQKGSTAGNGHSKTKKKWAELSPKEQLEWRLKVLTRRVEVTSTSTSYDWHTNILPALIKEDFGKVPKNFSKTVGALTARMGGKFRSSFVEQVKLTLSAEDAKDYLERFNALPK